jgi:predicted nucleic acid-binding protein
VAVYFLDSSAVLKRYVTEAGTSWVQALFEPASANRLAIATIAGAEVVAAVARRARGRSISSPDAATIIRRFRLDFSSDFDLIDVTSRVINQAMTLADRHALRGYDSVQLAAALAFNSEALSVGTSATLVSSDSELNAAAAAEGLTVEDPNRYP